MYQSTSLTISCCSCVSHKEQVDSQLILQHLIINYLKVEIVNFKLTLGCALFLSHGIYQVLYDFETMTVSNEGEKVAIEADYF